MNAEYRDVITPLHETARSGRKEVVELLIANGADVNAKNRNGDTPLDYAITFKRTTKSPASCANTAARRVKN